MSISQQIDYNAWVEVFCECSQNVRTALAERAAAGGQLDSYLGTVGAGGDQTLEIDALAEQVIFDRLNLFANSSGSKFSALSEERGQVDLGSDQLLVVIDPIDGSTNAKRGFPGHSISLALAALPVNADHCTMADVVVGVVCQIDSGETWIAIKGKGAWRLASLPSSGKSVSELLTATSQINCPDSEQLTAEGLLELVAVESARPKHLLEASDALHQHVHRIRAVGSIALSLCHVADGSVDGMASLWRGRSVDAAAAQLIVREAGGQVGFASTRQASSDPDARLSAALDLDGTMHVYAARSEDGLARIAQVAGVTD